MTQPFILIQQFLYGCSLVSQVNTQFFTILGETLHVFGNLVAIKWELTKLFIFISKKLVIFFDLRNFIFQSRYQVNIPTQDIF